ncbi:MAG: aromatic amino acid hydroxylase [Bdellovibrionales bacterium]|nr:aromatic amino acid hydroxylase [Bdellovibrionales bacterium]
MTIQSNIFLEPAPTQIPEQLKKYIVKQHYDQYTPEHQSTWRYIMRQLKDFLSKNAHPSYLKGLKETGITIDKIPSIDDIDKKLQKLGWRAMPVSGFIPPAAFMEFQLNNILPIASAIRTVEHISYTPAPDIVHEAAGHAPFLVHPVFNSFLKQYAKVVRKAITNKQDFEQYSAIRKLSDIKEDPNAPPEEIQKAQAHLNKINSELKSPSEASLLSRFIWFTSEYGLIGDMKKQKIYGAGLLSSLGEAKKCLHPDVKKIPLDSSCVEYSYDITDYQPQLFVTPDFETLHTVLEDLKKKCAFYLGGEYGLKKAKEAETVCTIELNTGLQISGVLENYVHEGDQTLFIKLKGACQLSYQEQQLKGHGSQTHESGYSTPLGVLRGSHIPPHQMSFSEFKKHYTEKNGDMKLEFASGWMLQGTLIESIHKDNKLILLRFKNCQVKRGDTIYYKPEWGFFDLALGEKISSVFGGPADRFAYGDLEDFEAIYVPSTAFTSEHKQALSFYQKIRSARESTDRSPLYFETLMKEYHKYFSKHWLTGVELLELAYIFKRPTKEKQLLTKKLISASNNNYKNEKRPFIKNAIHLIEKEHKII